MSAPMFKVRELAEAIADPGECLVEAIVRGLMEDVAHETNGGPKAVAEALRTYPVHAQRLLIKYGCHKPRKLRSVS